MVGPPPRAVVPSIWSLEAANATIMGERRKRLDEARSRRFFVLLEALPIILDEETGTRAFGDTVALARTYQLSAYDAAYLELAIRRGAAPALAVERLTYTYPRAAAPALVDVSLEVAPGEFVLLAGRSASGMGLKVIDDR